MGHLSLFVCCLASVNSNPLDKIGQSWGAKGEENSVSFKGSENEAVEKIGWQGSKCSKSVRKGSKNGSTFNAWKADYRTNITESSMWDGIHSVISVGEKWSSTLQRRKSNAVMLIGHNRRLKRVQT